MINREIKKSVLMAIIIMYAAVAANSQDSGCKVTMPSISGKYTGDCRKGLAHGQGTAQGIDSYSGGFRNGLPDGNGTYTWSNGAVFTGHWSGGMKDGTGKMITPDSAYTGIWKEDKYMGKQLIQAYKVDRSYNITKTSFFKSKNTQNVIRIRFFQGAVEQGGLQSADIAFNSGEQYRDGPVYGINNPVFPIDIRIKFTATTSLGQSQFDGYLDFTINEPGAWDVRISY